MADQYRVTSHLQTRTKAVVVLDCDCARFAFNKDICDYPK